MHHSTYNTISDLVASLNYWYKYHFHTSESWTLHYGGCVFMVYYNSGFFIGFPDSIISVPLLEVSESQIKLKCDLMIVGFVHAQ